MKLPATRWILPVLFLNISLAYGQSDGSPGYRIKVKTENGTYNGRLTNMLDSSIEITSKKNNYKKLVAITTIETIKTRKPFLKNVTYDLMLGAVAGAVVVGGYYLNKLAKGYSFRDDPPFGYALWTTMAFCASVGVLYGSFESAFVRINIPIHKAQYMFENKRDKLRKYITY